MAALSVGGCAFGSITDLLHCAGHEWCEVLENEDTVDGYKSGEMVEMVPGFLESEECVLWEQVGPYPIQGKTTGGVGEDMSGSCTGIMVPEIHQHSKTEVYKAPLCFWPGTVQATVHSGATGSAKTLANAGMGGAGTDCCFTEVFEDTQTLEPVENRLELIREGSLHKNTGPSGDRVFSSHTKTSRQAHVIVDFLFRQGGVITVVLTVIDNTFSWLNAQDLHAIIQLEQAREERTMQRCQQTTSRLSDSVGSSVEIGADIHRDIIEVEISDISSSAPSETSTPGTKALSLSILGRSGLRMAKASVTSLHQSISMTTLVAMFGDGSVTSRKGSVSKLSIMSTGDFETTQRDFHFGISRDTSSTVKCTKSGPSSMIIEKWMPSSLHGKSKARSFILESVVKLASFSSACSKRVSKIRNLFCCSRMSFESDDED